MLHALGAQRFQARDFRFDVVGLDVQMHAGLVLHLLHFDVQAARSRFELVVETEVAVIRVRDLQSERDAPERRRGMQVVDLGCR